MYYGIRAVRSRSRLWSLALCRPRSLRSSINFEKNVPCTPALAFGYCNSPIASFDGSHSADKTTSELSCKKPLCFNGSSPARPEDPRSVDKPELQLSCCDGSSSQEIGKLITGKLIRAVQRRRSGRLHLRSSDEVPGYVVDVGNPDVRHLLVAVSKLQIESLWSSIDPSVLTMTVFNMVISDASYSEKVLHRLPVLPRRINFDNSGQICNVGFVKALPGVKIKLHIPIYMDKMEDCVGVRKGGCLKVYLKHVALLCSPEDLFPCVRINVAMMDIGDRVCLSDLNLLLALHSCNDSGSVVCEVV